MATPKINYRVLIREKEFEMRLIEKAILVVTQDTTYRGGDGFSKLFAFIQGKNQRNQKISMTAPVVQSYQNELSIAFVMPEEVLGDVPLPVDEHVHIQYIENRRIVSIRFSGSHYQRLLPIAESKLRAWAKSKELHLDTQVSLARYNPPFLPGILRHNELWIDVL